MTEIVNKVAASGLITLKMEDFAPEAEVVSFDLADYLFKGLILREKDFREALKEIDWEQYSGKYLSVHCSADAIIPMWAWMLVAVHASPYVAAVVQSEPEKADEQLIMAKIQALDLTPYEDQRVVVKGCADREIPQSAYAAIAARLTPVVKSLMFGEPCSTVPLYKKPRK